MCRRIVWVWGLVPNLDSVNNVILKEYDVNFPKAGGFGVKLL